MMPVLPPFTNASMQIVAVALLVGACAAPAPHVLISSTLSARMPPPPPRYHLTQLDYGAHAAYGFCTPPACPTITRKTPASIVPSLEPIGHAVPLIAPMVATMPRAPRSLEPGMRGEAPLMVHFVTGSAALDQTAQRALHQLASWTPVGSRMRITGRTDNTGSPARNAALAHERAASVATNLRAQLAGKDVLLEIESAGVCCYLADNASSTGRQSNRRVEVTVAADDFQQVRQ